VAASISPFVCPEAEICGRVVSLWSLLFTAILLRRQAESPHTPLSDFRRHHPMKG
jgi:hypothetical protein